MAEGHTAPAIRKQRDSPDAQLTHSSLVRAPDPSTQMTINLATSQLVSCVILDPVTINLTITGTHPLPKE